MPSSSKYITLVERISQIEGHLLPPVNITGSYTVEDQDLIRSYCLLCHAEIEAYLESYSIEVISRAFDKWNNDKTNITPIIFHLAYSYNGKKDLPYSMVVQSYIAVKKIIESNNGIKENNINGFFKPIGFDIDPTLKSELNDFGKTRGEIAHTSFQTQNPLDPVVEKNRVVLILHGLKTFDRELKDYEDLGILNRTPTLIQWGYYTFLQRLKILFKGRL